MAQVHAAELKGNLSPNKRMGCFGWRSSSNKTSKIKPKKNAQVSDGKIKERKQEQPIIVPYFAASAKFLQSEAKIKAYSEENYEQILASRARKAVETSTALQQEQGFTETREAVEQREILFNGSENLDKKQGPSGAYAPAVAGMLMQQPTRQPEIGSTVDPEAQRIRELRAAIAGRTSDRCSMDEAAS
ncbi:hypothetical protein SELMODRAFT_432407 [Selaginella moellendorffii]|uniref:Uncharacterized protein n=1 Tax=Selaginella moellendorffii TaxID=88036 RepID=D8TFX0_SELML|nr:hypothetical protein SELMODRAFT_432407 [Selaginella moellendorffii]